MSDITLEQIKERLVPVLQQIGLVYTLDTKGKERERWDEMHRILSPLFLDISIAIDHQEENKPIRDTQFHGFAKALRKELIDLYHAQWLAEGVRDADMVNSEIDQLLARRAYDLASHVVGSCVDQEEECRSRCYKSELLRDTPDMTELPKESKE